MMVEMPLKHFSQRDSYTKMRLDVTDPTWGNLGLPKRAGFTNASNVVKLLTPVQ